MSTTHGSLSLQAMRRLQSRELLQNGNDIDKIVEITGASLSSIKRLNSKRVVRIVFERFGVQYISKLLYKFGLSQQIPDTQSPKRAQAVIDRWR